MRRSLLIIATLLGLVLSVSTTAQATPQVQPAIATSVTSVQQGVVTTASVLPMATTVSRSCSTGGYWYMTDSMFVTRTNVGGARPWKFVVTYSKNRTVYTGSTYVQHTARKLIRYSNGNILYYTPSQGFTVYTTSAYEDYRMVWDVYPSGSTVQTRICDVNW